MGWKATRLGYLRVFWHVYVLGIRARLTFWKIDVSWLESEGRE